MADVREKSLISNIILLFHPNNRSRKPEIFF